MQSSVVRWFALAGVAIIAFGVTASIGVYLLPEPRTETDYLVVGSIATLLALGILFATLIATSKTRDVFVRRRRKVVVEAGEKAGDE